jgi:hypothetical protein
VPVVAGLFVGRERSVRTSNAKIATIAKWTDNGAPRGDYNGVDFILDARLPHGAQVITSSF